MLPARTWSPPRTHALGKQRQNEQKCQEPAEAETILIDTTRNTVEKTDALQKHRKTVTMRAESLVTAEANFFGTLLDRQEEPQRHLNELSAQRGKQSTAIHSTQWKSCSEEKEQEETSKRALSSAQCVRLLVSAEPPTRAS